MKAKKPMRKCTDCREAGGAKMASAKKSLSAEACQLSGFEKIT